jgi:hypothetical protein
MQRRPLIFALALGLGALLTGCGPQWQVVQQAAPNPLLSQKKFAVLPIDYTGLIVGEKSEAAYLAEKDAEQRSSFAGDKAGMNEEFAKGLMAGASEAGIAVVPGTGPGAAPFEIRPHVSFVEPGFYAVVASKASEVRMTVRITAPDGRLIDEVMFSHSTDSQSGLSIGGISTNPSTGGRLRKSAEELGGLVAKYLRERTSGGD